MIKKVLILTAGYGEGHNSAARGLQSAWTAAGVDAETIDIFGRVGGAFYEQTRRGYLGVIQRASFLWSICYWMIDRWPMMAIILPFLGKLRDDLSSLLQEKQPVAVISVYPVYAYLIEALYPHPALRPFAFFTVVTDSITINSIWYRAASDGFFVPNEASAGVMRKAGVSAELIEPLGFPVALRFADDRPVRDQPSNPRVLFMINADPDLGLKIIARLLLMPWIHLTVACGSDEAFQRRIEAMAAGRPLELHGWTPRMPELMMTHHLLIGKAGGATVQESIAAGTPMLITKVVPGQEEGNAQLICENHCGAICSTPEAIAEQIELLFADDGALWRQWEKNIVQLSRPDASRQIAARVMESANRGVERQKSGWRSLTE